MLNHRKPYLLILPILFSPSIALHQGHDVSLYAEVTRAEFQHPLHSTSSPIFSNGALRYSRAQSSQPLRPHCCCVRSQLKIGFHEYVRSLKLHLSTFQLPRHLLCATTCREEQNGWEGAQAERAHKPERPSRKGQAEKHNIKEAHGQGAQARRPNNREGTQARKPQQRSAAKKESHTSAECANEGAREDSQAKDQGENQEQKSTRLDVEVRVRRAERVGRDVNLK